MLTIKPISHDESSLEHILVRRGKVAQERKRKIDSTINKQLKKWTEKGFLLIKIPIQHDGQLNTRAILSNEEGRVIIKNEEAPFTERK